MLLEDDAFLWLFKQNMDRIQYSEIQQTIPFTAWHVYSADSWPNINSQAFYYGNDENE